MIRQLFKPSLLLVVCCICGSGEAQEDVTVLCQGGDDCLPDSLEIVFPGGRGNTLELSEFEAGTEIVADIVMHTRTPDVVGWHVYVKHDTAFLRLDRVTTVGTIINPEEPGLHLCGEDPPAYVNSDVFPEGLETRVVLSFSYSCFLPVARNAVCSARYELIADPGEDGTRIELVDRELPVSDPSPIRIAVGPEPRFLSPSLLVHGVVSTSGGVFCELWTDLNEDGIPDGEEGPRATVNPGGIADMVLRLRNRGGETRNYVVAPEGLPESWTFRTEPPVPLTLAPGAEGTARVLLQAPVDPAAPSGIVAFSVVVSEAPGGDVCTLAVQVLLSPTPLPTILFPPDDVRLSQDPVVIRWRTPGPTIGRVYYRPLGSPGDFISKEDMALGAEHALSLRGLDPGEYAWYVEAEIAGSHPPVRAQSETRTFFLEPGVVFTRGAYRFEVHHDYNQSGMLQIENLGTTARSVELRLLEPLPGNLRVGFDRHTAGTEPPDPLLLPAGGTASVRLGIHAQDAAEDRYRLIAELKTVGEPIAVDMATVDIVVRTVTVAYTVEELPDSPARCTLARKFRITNHGDALTDLSVTARSFFEDRGRMQVTIVPSISHGLLRTNATLDFEVVPGLDPIFDPASEGPFVVDVRAAGHSRILAVEFLPRPGDQLYLASSPDLGLCALGKNWYCTNKRRIRIPLQFPGGFAPTAGGGSLKLLFTPEPGWHHRPHTVKIFLNGEDAAHHVGQLTGVIPDGAYDFYVPPTILVGPGPRPALNIVYLHTYHNGGHYVVTSRATLCVCGEDASVQRYLYASSQEDADSCLRGIVGISPKLNDLTVELEAVLDVFLGEAVPVVAHVTSGGAPVPGVFCKLRDTCSGDITDLWFSGGVYRGTWVARAEGTCRLEVIASACGVSASDEVVVTVATHPCDGLVSALNRQFHFYATCCEHAGEECTPRDNDEIGADPVKLFAALDNDDIWVLGFYPFGVQLFAGEALGCSFDGNTWYAAGAPDPSGFTVPEFAFDVPDLLPDPESSLLNAATINTVVREACGWSQGSVAVKGLIAHAQDLHCAGPEGPGGETILDVDATLPRIPFARVPSRLSFSYDAARDTFTCGSMPEIEIQSDVTGARFPPVDVAPFGFPLTLSVNTALGPSATLAWRGQTPATGAALPDAGVLALHVRSAVDLQGAAAVAVDQTILDWLLDAVPAATVSAVGTVDLSVEIAYAQRDRADGEVVTSPLPLGSDTTRRTFTGLRSGKPIFVFRALVDVALEAEITADFLGLGTDNTAVVLETMQLNFSRLLVVPCEPVEISGAAATVGGLKEAPFEPLPEVYPLTLTAKDSVGPGGGLFDVTILMPAAMQPVAGEQRIHVVRIPLAGKAIVAAEQLSIAVPLGAIARSMRAKVDQGGMTIDQAVEAVAMEIDLDRDGRADPMDDRWDLGGKAGTGIAVASSARESWCVGTEGQLEARLIATGDVAGQVLSFHVDGTELGIALTDSSGLAMVPYRPHVTGEHALEVRFDGDEDLLASSATITYYVDSAAPRVRLFSPAGSRAGQGSVDVVAAFEGSAPLTAWLEIDGVRKEEAATAGGELRYTWDTSSLELSSIHMVEVVVRDGEGRTTAARRAVRITEPVIPFVRGDANVDGRVDITDAVAILRYLFAASFTPPCLDSADVDDSGAIVINDPIRILYWLFGGGPPPAAPAPSQVPDYVPERDCAPDSTGDDLRCDRFDRCP